MANGVDVQTSSNQASSTQEDLGQIMLDVFAENATETNNWGQWKKIAESFGVTVIDDDSGFTNEKMLNMADAIEAIKRCTTKVDVEYADETEEERKAREALKSNNQESKCNVLSAIKQAAKEVRNLTVEEWRKEYSIITQEPPIGEVIETEDGSPIKINMEFHSGKPPILFTKIYVPATVCGKIGWFGQREYDENVFGWRVVILNGSRDSAIRKLDLTKPYALVRSLRIVKMATSQRSLLAEILEF